MGYIMGYYGVLDSIPEYSKIFRSRGGAFYWYMAHLLLFCGNTSLPRLSPLSSSCVPNWVRARARAKKDNEDKDPKKAECFAGYKYKEAKAKP